jgi:hypothetical protein
VKLKLPQGRSIQSDYFEFKGGLDLATPPMKMAPGYLLEAYNWDIPVTGGYRRHPGFERYSGQTRPSTASAVVLGAVTTFSGVAVGDTLDGDTSGAQGIVCYVSDDNTFVAVTKVTGSFELGEDISEAAVVVGVYATPPTYSSEIGNTIAAAAADEYRDDISKPAGSGAIRGVMEFEDVKYCWRDDAGGTASVMFKSTTSGWTAMTFGEEVYFTNANANVAVADTLTQGGVTATIARIVIFTGDQDSGVNTGKLVIRSRAGGNYLAGAATSTGAGALTLNAIQVAQTFSPAGKYRTRKHNFGGAADTFAAYCANGVNRAFEFDGTNIVFIDTGMTVDKPHHIAIYKNHLFLSYGSSVQHSTPGDPFLEWSVVMGAGELGIGTDVTNLQETTNVLQIYGINVVFGLFGSGTDNWALDPLVTEIGAREDTVQIVTQPIFLDQLGITGLGTSQKFGNFEGSQYSTLIKEYIADRVDLAACGIVVRRDSQYKLFFTDGTGVTLTFLGGKLGGLMPFSLPIVANCACESDTDGGLVLIGAVDGHVYELNRGRSFDGEEIDHRLRLAFNFNKSPHIRKHYRRASFDVYARGYASMTVGYIANRSDPDVDFGSAGRTATFGSGGSVGWDDPDGAWDLEFGFDGDGYARTGIELDVTATDLSFTISGSSDNQLPFTFSGQMLHYVSRRAERKYQ